MKGTRDTWSIQSGLADWTFILPARGGSDGLENLRARTREVLAELDGFARLAKLTLSTEERGEYAIEVTPEDAEDPAAVQNALGTPERVLRVMTDLDLLVSLEADVEDTWLSWMAFLWLEVNEDSQDGSVELHLSLHIDIYSAVTWGHSRDNRDRAQRNGPRLTSFLRRIREKLGGVCAYADSDYSYQVDENGFKPPT